MKNTIQLSVPKPCPEKWGSFKSTQQGGFCSSCQKEVIDFTSWSEDRLKSYFKNSRSNTCGQFKAEQLTTYTFDSHRSPAKGWFSVLLVSALLLFTSRQAAAQDIKPKQSTGQYEPEPETKIGKVKAPSTEVRRTGIVKDDTGEPMPGVNVVRKGTAVGTITDLSGRFMLRLENSTPSEVLVFSFIGFRAAEYPVLQNKPVQEFVIDMAPDITVLGGAMIETRWYSPRRWWWGIKRLF